MLLRASCLFQLLAALANLRVVSLNAPSSFLSIPTWSKTTSHMVTWNVSRLNAPSSFLSIPTTSDEVTESVAALSLNAPSSFLSIPT